ncbi:hypothetical protein CHS0354_034483 [Potamilus streckersoni]|uniref:Uncharacterized protein n=1 Tax=Potamilus streckersoni TaxID=2493646 RepID=A0AAE0T1T7_9BIVA|nr:hypothetical protein CHS0354_034483 [Potamilus streckersoni]
MKMSQRLVLLCCFVFMFVFDTTFAQTLQSMKTLMTNLTDTYNKNIRPVKNQATPVSAYVEFMLLSMQDFDEVEEKLSIVAGMGIIWNDANMVWDPSSFGNITKVFFSYKDVWVPDVVLSNPYDAISTFGEDWQKIAYTYDGAALWPTGNVMHTKCSVDVRFYPFDSQTCTISLYPWGYSYTEVMLHTVSDRIETSQYSDGGSWELVSTSTKSMVNVIWSSVEFTLTFKRKATYVIVNVILPIIFLGLLNVLVFVLPPESGERVSYAITVLLAVSVFLTIVGDNLPKTSEPMAFLSYFLVLDLALSAVVTLVTVLNLKVYHNQDNSNKKVPRILRSIAKLMKCCDSKVKPIDMDAIYKDDEKPKISKTILVQCQGVLDENATVCSEEECITWKNASKAMDKLSFLTFMFLKVANIVWFIIATASNRA